MRVDLPSDDTQISTTTSTAVAGATRLIRMHVRRAIGYLLGILAFVLAVALGFWGFDALQRGKPELLREFLPLWFVLWIVLTLALRWALSSLSRLLSHGLEMVKEHGTYQYQGRGYVRRAESSSSRTVHIVP